MSIINATPLLAAAGGDYQISRSVRLRSSASAYFSRTPASAGNRKTWTWSGWVKRGASGDGTGSNHYFLFSANDGGGGTLCDFYQNTIRFYFAGGTYLLQTTQVFRDYSAWYHIVVSVDTTQATSTNRVKLYVNGVQITSFSSAGYPTQNLDSAINGALAHYIGKNISTNYFDGYLTEVFVIDGQALTPSSFGETDSITGVWKPKKYAGTYGTNGFYLNFSDNSAATAAAIGKDYSGNGNNWTPNNISVTAGVTYDSMLDVPTLYADGGNGRGNYAVLNPINLKNTAAAISDANLTVKNVSAAQHAPFMATVNLPSKHYWEIYTTGDTGTRNAVGIANNLNNTTTEPVGFLTGQAALFIGGGGLAYYKNQSSADAFSVAWASGNILHCAYDESTGKFWIGQNGVWYNSTGGTTGDPATGTNPTTTFTAGTAAFFPAGSVYNQGTNSVLNYNFGQRPFAYTPPTGFKALNTQNLPEPTIKQGDDYFNAVLYTGTGADLAVTGVGFQPDFIWTKGRSAIDNHVLVDSIRGIGQILLSNATAAESTYAAFDSFDSDGFTKNGLESVSGRTYVAWNWKANGAGVTNTAGSITSQVSANTTSGFSVVTFTSTLSGSGSATIGHGLGVAPAMIIVKIRNAVNSWGVYHKSIGNTALVYLELTSASNTAIFHWNNTSPTSTVFTVGYGGSTGSAGDRVAYCFSEVAGFSKFGSYTGNGSADGPFVYCGFRPAFIMIKRTDSTGNWTIHDNERLGYNGSSASKELYPNLSNAEGSDNMDQLSNGFKLRDTYADVNASGGTYIFMAFAESPFKTSLAR